VAIEDGISVAEVLNRGTLDLKLRVAFAQMGKKGIDDGSD